jgi:hypothetical protein
LHHNPNRVSLKDSRSFPDVLLDILEPQGAATISVPGREPMDVEKKQVKNLGDVISFTP